VKAVTEEERKVQVGISCPPDLLKTVDLLRGREPRSHFVCRMLRRAIKEELLRKAIKEELRR